MSDESKEQELVMTHFEIVHFCNEIRERACLLQPKILEADGEIGQLATIVEILEEYMIVLGADPLVTRKEIRDALEEHFKEPMKLLKALIESRRYHKKGKLV